MKNETDTPDSRYGPRRLTVELTNTCNLHCGYCLRDEEALYHTRSQFMSLDLLRRIVREAKEVAAITEVNFTGGEPTLHPQFAGAIDICGAEETKVSFVSNGWNFEKLWPELVKVRGSLSHVAFSIDGITAESHDRWRGNGSFVRLIRAFSRCHCDGLPFVIKVGIRRDTLPLLEGIAMFAARLGASGLSFAHVMPTSEDIANHVALSVEERRRAEEEITLLARIFKMKVSIDVGYYNIEPNAPCSPLAGASYNVDYQGRLTLCCNLSGFRGAKEESDVVSDLNVESFAEAWQRFNRLKDVQLERRRLALSEAQQRGVEPDLYLGSPCLFCLNSFKKLPWHSEPQLASGVRHSLPVVNS
jgi:MoaA/NifB/PqqE/SkfB family radical SAM enzyme